ncbi:MAG TPA: SDR family oxidoreductase [Kiloniellales bacterium]|jgi:NAD(P)-dependent dehydrogenase (short-subunit alcohol dehydrogenase family)
MTDTPVKGRVFVVTGGTQGIGEAIAHRLARAGAGGVVIAGRDQRRGQAVCAEISGLGAKAHFVGADLAAVASCRTVVAACAQHFGRLDGLVNAAGITDRGGIDDTTPETWDRLFAVNVRAPFFLAQDAVKLMRRNPIEGLAQAGAIVNIITMSSHGGQPKLTAYAASKGALVTLTRNLGHALRHQRIRVNGLNIGWTDTPNEHQVQRTEGQPDDWLVRAEAKQPFGRLIKPADVAEAALFLLGPASGVMTGAVIDYDQMVIGAYE